jgi:hypothetical protein
LLYLESKARAKARAIARAKATADPFGMTTNRNGQGTKLFGESFTFPPFAKNAKDGAPFLLWRGE